MNPTPHHIIGAGGFGRETRTLLAACNLGFGGYYDDNTALPGVIGPVDSAPAAATLVVAIGNSITRRAVQERLPEAIFPNLFHPSALIQDPDSVQWGRGNLLTAVNILTCNITIGDFCIINLKGTIGHDCVLSSFCSLMPSVNLGGNVHLEEGVFIGTGATILPGVRIGAWATVGAGAVVTKDIPEGETWAGVPAVRIKN